MPPTSSNTATGRAMRSTVASGAIAAGMRRAVAGTAGCRWNFAVSMRSRRTRSRRSTRSRCNCGEPARTSIDLAFGNPDLPSPDVAVEKLDRSGAQPAQPSVLDEQGHPEAAPRGRRSVRAQVRRHARLRDRGVLDHRRQGRLLAPDARARRAGRHRARAVAVVPDSHLGPDPRRCRRALRAHGSRSGLLREPAQRVRTGVAAATRDRHVVPAQPHDGVRRSRVHGTSSSRSPANARSSSCTTSRTPTSASTATSRRRSCRSPARRTSRSSSTR